MAASFFDQIKSLAPPEVVERLAGGLGESPQATGKALSGAAIPAVLGGLEQQFGSGAGPARLLGLVKQQDPDGRLLDNLHSGGLGEAEHVGQGVVGNLFGQRGDKVADSVAAHSGVSKSSAISLLSIAGAMIFGWLGQRVARGGLDATGLGAMLSGVRGEIGRFAPPGLTAAMGTPKAAEPAGTYAASAAAGGRDAIYRDEPASRGAGAPKAAAGPAARPRWLAWLIPAVIVLGILAWLISRMHVGAPQAPHAPTATTPQVHAPAAPTTAVPTPQAQAPNANAPTTSPQTEAPNANAPTTAPQAQAPNANAPTAAPQAQAPNAQVQLPSGAHLNLAPNSLAYGLANYLGNANAPAAPRRFTFQNMIFPTAGSTPTAASQRVLSDVATILRAYPNTRIEVQGFTDTTGSPQHNLALSQRRAEQVRTALIQRGVPADRVTAQGFGQAHPVASNANNAGRAQNRRTDIVVVSR